MKPVRQNCNSAVLGLWLVLLSACGNDAADSSANGATPVSAGPANGTLIAAGGNLHDPAILQRFVQLAGGPVAPIVVVPTALEGDINDVEWDYLEDLRAAGAKNLGVLHTRDPAEADSDAFVAPLEYARGVWFVGGRQWRIADAYLGTKTEAAFRAVLDRGGVIGGSSAGATIQGSYLARGDTETNTVMMGDHQQGFGYLQNVAIDQHLLVRNRQFDLIEIVTTHPELLGIGIDEDTAIVVTGNEFEVIGQGYVAIYDHGSTVGPGGPFYFLMPGDRFELGTRTPHRPDDDSAPFAPLRPEAWSGDDAQR